MKKYLWSAALLLASPLSLYPQYHETAPGSADSLPASGTAYSSYYYDQIELPVTEERPGFFRRFGNYFRDANIDRTQQKGIDFSFIGGPFYNSSVKLGIGLMAAGLYRIDKTDLTIPPSNISIFGSGSTSGFYVVGVRGNNYFTGAKYRLDYRTAFISMPTDFWGIGYQMGKDDENKTSFVRKKVAVKVDFMYKLVPNLYAGINASFDYVKGKDFDQRGISYLRGQNTQYTNNGYGLFLMYDSRDYITAPHRGWYAKFENVYFPSFTGNNPGFNRMELTVDYYHKIWKGGIMAYDLHGLYNSGNAPWTMLAEMGGSSRMRGYYEGRYRDKGLAEVQAELRQNVYRRIGLALWGGAGTVFDSFSNFDTSHILPNYGLGFRWEFKNRVNVRLDYGFGKNTSSFMFAINEAF